MTRARPTLSVVVPALDEERHVADAVRHVRRAIDDRFEDWEILLFDDGSRDATGRIMDELAAEDAHIRVVHNRRPRNVGGVYRQGIERARFDYVMMVPGDAENPTEALVPVLQAIGRADVVLPFATNDADRGLGRFVLSRAYTALVNGLFGLRVPYYNGTAVMRTAAVREVALTTDGFAFQAELLVKLLRAGESWVGVGIRVDPRPGRKTKAFRPRNVASVLRAIASLFVEERLGGTTGRR